MGFGNPDYKWSGNMTQFQIEDIEEGIFTVYMKPSKGYVCVIQNGKALKLLIRFHSRDEDPVDYVEPTLANIIEEGYAKSDTELVDEDYKKFVTKCVNYENRIKDNSFRANLYINDSVASRRCLVGDKLKLRVSANGGAEQYGYEYKYAMLNVDSGEWTILKQFNSSYTMEYEVKTPGIKQFVVTVKDGTGKTVSTDRVTIDVLDKMSGSLTVNNSTASLVKAKGSEITLEAKGNGGDGHYRYKFSVLNVGTGKWSVLKDFDWKSTYTYNLNYKGEKQFAVTIKDWMGNTVATNRITVNVVDPQTLQKLKGELKVDNSTAEITKKIGSKITLNAKGTGGSGSYTYKFAILNTGTGKWTVLRNFSSNSTYVYTLNYLGVKQFAVTVKDSLGKTVSTNRLTVNVVKELPLFNGTLTANGTTSKLVKEQGDYITLKATGKNGSGSYTYKFAVLNADTGKWTVLRNFNITSEYVYCLNTLGIMQFAVTVKDITGKTVATNRVSVEVKDKPYIIDNSNKEAMIDKATELILKLKKTCPGRIMYITFFDLDMDGVLEFCEQDAGPAGHFFGTSYKFVNGEYVEYEQTELSKANEDYLKVYKNKEGKYVFWTTYHYTSGGPITTQYIHYLNGKEEKLVEKRIYFEGEEEIFVYTDKDDNPISEKEYNKIIEDVRKDLIDMKIKYEVIGDYQYVYENKDWEQIVREAYEAYTVGGNS